MALDLVHALRGTGTAAAAAWVIQAQRTFRRQGSVSLRLVVGAMGECAGRGGLSRRRLRWSTSRASESLGIAGRLGAGMLTAQAPVVESAGPLDAAPADSFAPVQQ
jgi:hypothetical protein